MGTRTVIAPIPWIVMRSHNDMPVIAETLSMLRQQDCPSRLLVFDNASTDGTLEEVQKYADVVRSVPAGKYVPGQVLNQAMKLTNGEIVVFLNSDCTPANTQWLRSLIAHISDSGTAAVFGRQIPRSDCAFYHAQDTENAYGDGVRQESWRHCFSMASSAIRRSVWNNLRFDESLQYSEDIDWTWRARQEGHHIRYAPNAVVQHSHNYTLRAFYKRHYGEGGAEARIFSWTSWQASIFKYSLLPYTRQVMRDLWHCHRECAYQYIPYSFLIRIVQFMGRRAGFRNGLKQKAAS